MNDERCWYALVTHRGYEEKVKKTLEHRRLTLQAEDRILRIETPPAAEENKHGFVLVLALIDDETLNLLRNTPGVRNIAKLEGKYS